MDKKTLLLVGSLSNDLFRIANLTQRGNIKGASRFLSEAKRWAKPLKSASVKPYIQSIAADINNEPESEITLARAETYLMYGVLLQNYALHITNSL